MQIKLTCLSGHKEIIKEISDEQWRQWTSGESYIQDIFPTWTPEERDMLKTQICDKCLGK